MTGVEICESKYSDNASNSSSYTLRVYCLLQWVKPKNRSKRTFRIFSSIKRKFEINKTRTIKFLKPRKLGAASLSWLRHDVRGLECTAATCLYFFCVYFRKESGVSSCVCVRGFGKSATLILVLFFPIVPLTCESVERLMAEEKSGILSVPVTVEFSEIAISKMT